MKKLLIPAVTVLLLAACNPQKNAVTTPVTTIDVETLNQDIDLQMDISALSLGDCQLLRNAFAARQGYPFKDAYLRGVFSTTTWYDSLVYNYDAELDLGGVEECDDESWRDHYYRGIDETGALKYSADERAFMQRLEEREAELLKHNFDTGGGQRVNLANLSNPLQVKQMDEDFAQRLAANGFVIVPAKNLQLFHTYEQNDYAEFPSFVTTDLYLQLYHHYFDCLMREVEEKSLLPLMTAFSRDMFNATHQMYVKCGFDEEMNRLTLHNAAFFSIAYQLFTGEDMGIDEEVQLAQTEVEKVMKAESDFSDFLMDYKNVMFPYSLFRPRGHYTRTEPLKRYFRGMMWLQSAPFGMDNREELKEAVLMALAMKGSDKARQAYDQLNQLLTFLMGTSDNLGILQVVAEVEKTGRTYIDLIDDDQALDKIGKALAEADAKQTRIRPKFEKTSHVKVCVMPQRYQPDAEVLQEMVDYDSEESLRPLPCGLDVMAAMGVSPAEKLLREEGQKWKGFDAMLEKMKQRMAEIDWEGNVSTRWLDAVKTVTEKQAAMPYFMQTAEWDKKNLNAALSSWAELKHDAILYAKQPFGAECGGGGVPDPVVKGYVEPNTAFWQKAIDLLDATEKTLADHRMLPERAQEVTQRLREEAQFLLQVSKKELEGKLLTDEEYDQLQYIGATFENISLDLLREPDQYLMGWDDVQGPDRNMAVVADVYTANADNNPNKCILYEGVGQGDEIYVVVELGGRLYLTRGAVFSYREFHEPMDQPRLTDEEWQKALETNPRKGTPQWMEDITVPADQAPEHNEEIFYSSGC